MNKFLIPLLTAIALPTAVKANWSNWFGRYGFFTEAKRACDKCANDGIYHKTRSSLGTFPRKSRFCQYDNETRQFSGWAFFNDDNFHHFSVKNIQVLELKRT